MSEKFSGIKKGDRVRIVLEDEVVHVSDRFLDTTACSYDDRDGIVSIEVLPPPVVQFQPGDVVRDKDISEHLYALGEKGYTHLTAYGSYAAGSYGQYGEVGYASRDWFTSESFEKVEL